MENSSNNNEQLPNEVGSNLTGTAKPSEKTIAQGEENSDQQQSDREFLDKAQENEPDTIQKPEDIQALIGDVHPTTREDISQEQANGDSINESESRKISGEQL
jgi:hypothetical protein